MVEIGKLLKFMVEQGASDLHISAGESPMVRIRGELARIDLPPLSPDQAHTLLFDVMTDSNRRKFQQDLEVDFAYTMGTDMRFRVNAFVQNRGEGAVFRHIPSKIPRWEALGLPPVLRQFCACEKGLVLVTGPTGSGKSTTLAAMVNLLNEHKASHILTLEDPIEFVHTPKRSLVNQRGNRLAIEVLCSRPSQRPSRRPGHHPRRRAA